jgi:hypothetical protein
MKQKVEILKALVRGAKILILDEPTAVLTTQETSELFKRARPPQGAGLYDHLHLAQAERDQADHRPPDDHARRPQSVGVYNTKRRQRGGDLPPDGRPRRHSQRAEGQGAAHRHLC